jgi:hypothetical protein
LFGDSHSRVASSSVRLCSFCSSFPPFLIKELAGRFVAFKPDRSGFVGRDWRMRSHRAKTSTTKAEFYNPISAICGLS